MSRTNHFGGSLGALAGGVEVVVVEGAVCFDRDMAFHQT